MTDDRRKRGPQGPSDRYEVRYFARKYGLAIDEARRLISRVGNNREHLKAAVEAGQRIR